MRVNPSAKALRSDNKEEMKALVERTCRVIAIIVAALSTFSLFFKILFF